MIGTDARVDHRQLTATVRTLDHQLGAVEAGLIDATMAGLRAKGWRDDGHQSVQAWLRATTGWSDPRISRCVRNARLCTDAPDVLTALRAGQITIDRVDVLARAYTNERVREPLLDTIDQLLVHAAGMPHHDFDLLVRRFVSLMDADGAHHNAEHAHNARHLRMTMLDDGTLVFTGEMTGPQAAHFRAVLDAYTHTEWLIDRDRAIALHGPDYTADQLPRTHRQRMVDALARITLDAATHAAQHHPDDSDTVPAPVHEPEPSVVVHADLTTITKALELLRPTLDQTIALHDVGTLTLGELNRRLADGLDPARLHANTGDGQPLAMADILTALIIGKIRLVIEDETGIITHAGRTRRLFTGPQRDLVLAAALHCTFGGCATRPSRCEADHLTPHSHGGATDIDNGAPSCDHHNRWRHRHGYHITRDTHGHWHTWRPDGTQL